MNNIEKNTINAFPKISAQDTDPEPYCFSTFRLDSLAAVEFRNRMQSAFGGLRLSPTLMFDYPTVADLSDYVRDSLNCTTYCFEYARLYLYNSLVTHPGICDFIIYPPWVFRPSG